MDLKEIISTIMAGITLLALFILVFVLVITFLKKEYNKYLRKIELQIKTYELLNKLMEVKLQECSLKENNDCEN